MELKEALKAKQIGEAELAVISANIHLVSDKDLVRLGLATKEEVKEAKTTKKETAKKEKAEAKK